MPTLEERIAALESRLQAVEDESAIQQTLYAYSRGLDYHLEDEFRDVWTEDAVLDHVSIRHEGLEQIMERAWRHHSHAPEVFHKHWIGVTRLWIDGDEAVVHSYGFRLNMLGNGPEVFAYGRYRDNFVRCADGRWRIKLRTIENEGMSPWSREDVAELLAHDGLAEKVASGELRPELHASQAAQVTVVGQ
jgi:hypothetical protein